MSSKKMTEENETMKIISCSHKGREENRMGDPVTRGFLRKISLER